MESDEFDQLRKLIEQLEIKYGIREAEEDKRGKNEQKEHC